MEEQFDRERTSLEEQKRLLREELESLREELAAKLNIANSEVMCAPKLQPISREFITILRGGYLVSIRMNVNGISKAFPQHHP